MSQSVVGGFERKEADGGDGRGRGRRSGQIGRANKEQRGKGDEKRIDG